MGGMQFAARPWALPELSSHMHPFRWGEDSTLRIKEQKPLLLLRLTGKPPVPPASFHSLNALGPESVCAAGRIRLTMLAASPGQSMRTLVLSGSFLLNLPASPCSEDRRVCLFTGPFSSGSALRVVVGNVKRTITAKKCSVFIPTPCVQVLYYWPIRGQPNICGNIFGEDSSRGR